MNTRLFLAPASIAAVVLTATPVLTPGEIQDTRRVPDPDLTGLEPQVVEKFEDYRIAVLAEPESHEAWGRLAMLLHVNGWLAEATECYEQAAALEPGEFRWHYLLIHTLRDLDPEQGLFHAQQASQLRPLYSSTYIIQGLIQEELNQPEKALENYARAAAVDSRCGPAELGLGRVYLAKGELENARQHLLRAVELEKEALAPHALLAQVYRRLGEKEAALREQRLAAELTGQMTLDDPVFFQMKRQATSTSALLRRAGAAEEAGAHRRAETLYRQLLEIRPNDANVHEKLGNVLAAQDKPQLAMEHYLQALAITPDNPSLLYNLGNLLNFEGRHDEAAEHYRRGLELRPDHLPTLINLGGILAFQGDLAEAAKLYQKVLELDTDNFAGHRQLGQILLRQGHIDESLSHFHAALALRPDFGPLHVQIAIALTGKGDYRAAWKHVEQAEELGITVPPNLIEELERLHPRTR